MCYVDLLAASDSDGQPPPLRCNCPPLYTGERCETPVSHCDSECYNGGTCTEISTGSPTCTCRSGFTGSKCQNCEKLTCQNGGICTKIDGKDACKCPDGFEGAECQIESCQNYCGSHGTCMKSSNGIRCKCDPGYTGLRCDRDACYKHCQNGGTCRIGTKQPQCVCSPAFAGRRCEIELCTIHCKNNGTCVRMYNGIQVCKCPEQWGGSTCDVSLNCAKRKKLIKQNYFRFTDLHAGRQSLQ